MPDEQVIAKDCISWKASGGQDIGSGVGQSVFDRRDLFGLTRFCGFGVSRTPSRIFAPAINTARQHAPNSNLPSQP
jgi:hypothetical protein